jgi:hypothetical protein
MADLFGLDCRAQSEWSSVYLLIVFAIAALIMLSLIKGLFRDSQKVREGAQDILRD